MENIKTDLPAYFTYPSTPLRLYFENILNFQMNMKCFFISIDGFTSSFNITSRKAHHRVQIMCTAVIYIIRIENNSHPFITLPVKRLVNNYPARTMWMY